MGGHRDDGTFAEDNARHAGRRVSREAIMDKHVAEQQAMWKGIDAAGIASHVSELDEESWENDNASPHGIPRPNLDEVLDPWDPEDTQEQYNLKEERLKKGHY